MGVGLIASVCFQYLKIQAEGVFWIGWIVVQIVYFLITDGLNIQILCGADGKTALIDRLVGLCFRPAQFIDQIVEYIIDDRIHEVGICGSVSPVRIILRDPGVDIVRHRLIVLGLGNVPLLQHGNKHTLPPFRIFIRMGDRIVAARVLGNSGYDGALRQGKLGHILAEIAFRSSLYAKGVGTQINGV